MASTAFVIAHYDPKGAIAQHLRSLAAYLASQSAHVVFVSTGVAPGHAACLPESVKVMARTNIGYDFSSYKCGIQALGDLSRFERIVMLNSSFICLNPRKLFTNLFAQSTAGFDVLGVTASQEFKPHLQSYLVSFQNQRLISSTAFLEWWASVEPLSERDRVVYNYEVGMSSHFLGRGFSVGAAFAPTPALKQRAAADFLRFKGHAPAADQQGRAMLDEAIADALNPMHFCWDAVLNQFAIIKLELLSKNPYDMDLRSFQALCRSDPSLMRLVEDALGGGTMQ
jgi:rhamnosyltransferase